MAYRDLNTVLLARREALVTERQALERDLDPLRERSREVDAQLDELNRLLDASGKRRLPMLSRVKVATPCHASWNEMVGDDRVRFCGACGKNVYDLSALTSNEAEALLYEHEGNLCARFFRRDDGTILTSDCPTGVRRRRRKLALVGVGLAAGVAGAALIHDAFSERPLGGVDLPEQTPDYAPTTGGLDPIPVEDSIPRPSNVYPTGATR